MSLNDGKLILIVNPNSKLNIQNILNQGFVEEAITYTMTGCQGYNRFAKCDLKQEGCNLLYEIKGEKIVLRYIAFEINKLHRNKIMIEQMFNQEEKEEK